MKPSRFRDKVKKGVSIVSIPVSAAVSTADLLAATRPVNATALAAMAVLHQLSASLRLYLSKDRSALPPTVRAYNNQSYMLRVRFAAPLSGWWFDELLSIDLPRPSRGYYGHVSIERAELYFAPGEALEVTLEQADWRDVTLGDWRGLHATIWELRLCGVPQTATATR